MKTSSDILAPVVVLNAPRVNWELIIYARAMYGAFLDNPSFPNPNPPLATFAANIAAFEDAETKAATRAKGSASLRDAKKKKLMENLNQYRGYVQCVVDTDMTPAAACAVIESAFMSIKKVAKRTVPELSVKNADVSGKVRLAAKSAGTAAVYSFEYSVDQAKWTPLPNTMKSRTEVSGLTSACTYYFRFRTFTRAGWQDYSPVVSLLVR